MTLALLEVTDLVVHYGKALALERVSLSVERGQLVGVLGPNGAGKTTRLKAISRSVNLLPGMSFLTAVRLTACPRTRLWAAASVIAQKAGASSPNSACLRT